jgi:hypothetical protein
VGDAAGAAGDPPGTLRDSAGGRLIELPIEQELKDSYLTYAMSVIVARALPDVRDGLNPSQRRILVAMNDLNLSPGAARVKCAKISGDTSGNYHPHGESVIYPTLVRMAQEWNMRHVLIDKQGNFGSIAGLPAAAMRYTEARLSPISAMLLDDLELDTVDYVPTYDERNTEPVVLPGRFPNLLVNGAGGIAVGMATSIPPHNLGEICRALVALIDDPGISLGQLLQIVPGPDFPTGGIVMGREALLRGYATGRSTITLRARATVEEFGKNRTRIVVTEVPYQQTRDAIEEKIAELVNEDRIRGISAIRNESDLKEPVRLVLELKRDADPDVVLNQLYQFSPLQTTFSLIFLALVDGKPRILTFKNILEEFLRHRTAVLRRRTQHLLQKARSRKHTLEGLLVALANIDEVIRIIRSSRSQAEAKERLTKIEAPAALLERALGPEGFAVLQEERGVSEAYGLSPVQADAILNYGVFVSNDTPNASFTVFKRTGMADSTLDGYSQIRLLESSVRLTDGDGGGTHRGSWATGTAYVVGDTVIYIDRAYICILNSTGNVPLSSPTYWTDVTDLDSRGRSRFSVYNSGRVDQQSLTANATDTLRDAPEFYQVGAYWSAAASHNYGLLHKVVVDGVGTAQYRLYFGDPGGAPSLKFIFKSDGTLDLQNGDIAGVNNVTFKTADNTNSVDLQTGSISNCTNITGTLVNLQTSGTQFDHYVNGSVHAEYAAPADGETALLLRRNVGGSYTLQRVSMGADDSGGTGYKVLRVPN